LEIESSVNEQVFPISNLQSPIFNSLMPELALGTAQLGMPYGVASAGRPSSSAAQEILAAAIAMGVRCFETAPAYGDSELTIGTYLRSCGADDLRIITKISRLPHGMPQSDLRAAVLKSLEQSRKSLGVKTLDAVLIHSAENLLHYRAALVDVLLEAVDAGLARRAGVSLYEVSELQFAAEFQSLVVLQYPFSVFDTRFGASGSAALMENRETLARSILLQGLLLLSADAAERAVAGAGAYVTRFRQICGERSIEPVHAAVGFAAATSGADYLLVGVESVGQLDEIEEGWSTPLDDGVIRELQEAFGDVPANVRDPRRWPQRA